MEEEKWLEQAIKGDIPAFEALIRAYEGRIYHIALKALGNAEDAGDATQETLLKIYRFLPDFKGQSRFSTWVYRIAVNTCYDFLRQNARRKRAQDDDLAEDMPRLSRLAGDKAEQPEQMLEQKLRKKALDQAIARLSPEHRMMIILRDIQGLSYARIAAITSLSEGTVKSRLSRARRALRRRLLREGTFFETGPSKE